MLIYLFIFKSLVEIFFFKVICVRFSLLGFNIFVFKVVIVFRIKSIFQLNFLNLYFSKFFYQQRDFRYVIEIDNVLVFLYVKRSNNIILQGCGNN